MSLRINELLGQIKVLEEELLNEIQKQEDEFKYTIKNNRVCFERAITLKQREFKEQIFKYLFNASFLNFLTTPIIWAILFPAIILDLFVSIYQVICFRIYKIPMVKRGEYIKFDRHYLSYLNIIEKVNCFYCSYFNGLIAYIGEISARTEQFWCPIKHAKKIKSIHSRYQHFFEYGDINFKKEFRKKRREFEDI